MSSDVQDFANRLSTALEERFRASRHLHLSVDVIQQAIQRALHPEDVTGDFPRMLFRASSEQRTVTSREEEAAALAEGFTRTPPSLFEPGYPRWFCEKPTSLGGWKPFDLRRVMLRTPEELRQFEAVIELDDWVEGSVENVFGARGISLGSLVDERKDLLKRLVDQEQLEIVVEEAPGLPCDVAVPEPVTGGQNPDEAEGQEELQ